MAELPTGTVSFLFTDIEGSTRLLQQLRDRYGEVLADHHRLLRTTFEELGGRETGTEGDAFFVAFARARNAVAAAASAQRALAAHAWPEGAEVRVRMGIHTGEPSVGEEGYHGLTLHRAARIAAAGHGGQVLLSNATRELVEDDLPAEVALRDLGERRLKDLDRPERIFQLVIEGLRNDFPPLRTLEPEEAPRRGFRRRSVIAAAAIVVAAAVAIPVFALGGGGGGSLVPPDSVGAIDPGANKVVAQVAVGATPGPLVAAAGALWVGNLDDRSISRVDLATKRVKAISMGEVPGDLAATAGALWAVSSSPGRDFALVRRIDPTFQTVVKTIRIPGSSFGGGGGAIAADDRAVWASTGSFSQVSRIVPGRNRVAATFDAGSAPTRMATGGGALWVADGFANTVARVDPRFNTVAATIQVGHVPTALAFGEGAVWVADALDNSVVRIDPGTNAVTTTIPVGRVPTGIAVGRGAVWVANSRDGTVSRIDPAARKVVATIRVGGSPQDVAVAGGRVWVSVQVQRTEVALTGGTVRVTAPEEVDSLDPALAQAGLAWQVEYATCAKLLNYPDRPGSLGSQLVPDVAASLPEVSKDGKTYTFTVRRGFRFSPPSGERVTARTFAYTIERAMSPQLRRGSAQEVTRPSLDDVVGATAYEAGRADRIAGIAARGDRLTIRLTAPAPDLPARLAQPFFCAVPTDTPAVPGGVRTVPSAGPYYVASYVPAGRIVLKRNPNYAGPRPHRLREIDVALDVPPAESVAGVETGSADYAANSVEPQAAARLEARYGASSPAARAGREQYFVNPQLNLDFLILNARRPFFASARLRRAVSYAIDRTALARADVFPAEPADHYLPPGMPGFRPGRLYAFRPDVAAARRLARGARGTAVFFTCDLPACTEIAQIVRQNLLAVGISVRVKSFPVARYPALLTRTNAPFDIAFFGQTAETSDPGSYFERVSLFDVLPSPAYRRKLRAAAKLTGAARYRAYGNLDVDLARNAAPLAVFGVEVRRDLFSSRMGCQVHNPLYGIDLAALCIRR